jgi:hypothetical protein
LQAALPTLLNPDGGHNMAANRRRKIVQPVVHPINRRGKILVAANPSTMQTPDDAFSDLDELAVAAYYPQSSLSNLAAWGVIVASTRPSLSQLDRDLD